MCGIIGSVVTLIVGAILVVVSCVITFVAVPSLVETIVANSVVLIEDTIQMERFEQVPFSLNFSVTVFNISNANEVLNGGVAVVNEFGPYVYRLYQSRNVTAMEEDVIKYRKIDYFEFDAAASYPYSEDDLVTVINVPYHAVLQIAEKDFPELMTVLPLALNGIFGPYNSPIINVRVGDLLKDKIPMCTNPGIIGTIACAIIRDLASTVANIEINEDGSLSFSILANKHEKPSPEYEVYRGLENPRNLGKIRLFDGLPYFNIWADEEGEDGEVIKSRCNNINGTDAGIFPPFMNRSNAVYAMDTDVCRSVELRFQQEVDYEGIPAYRYSANEWFLDNNEGCFCLNTTAGITQENGCLFKGAMELYNCVGGHLVLSYPHFLYADLRYRNGILGMRPNVQDHRIFMDIEPMTGTPVNGAKRAQFNIFSRPVPGISATQNLRLTLMPILWVEEGFQLPKNYVAELKDRMVRTLNLLSILLPTIIAIFCVVLLVGIILTVKARSKKPVVMAAQTQ